ncbi:MAG: helix-turn-helix domain-containing protein [Bacteroidaceae bacterium]|nr:helix-turn-helix domain-containing protein [Bacteroidaceae bacterium]
MPEQITPLSILYLLLHGAGTAVSVVLFLYLLLCRGKAIAPGITPPARLRHWAAALFCIMAMAHIWWMLFYTYSNDTHSVVYGLLVATDCMALPPVFVGTLLNMLQDRRRPLWPIVVAMTPCAVVAVLQTALPSIDLTTPNMIYGLILAVAFIIYMVVAVRQYGRWLRDNYADLEHKEMWLSLTLLISLMLLLLSFEYTDSYVMSIIAHLTGFPLAGLLLWRVETLKDLSTDNPADETDHAPTLLRGEWSEVSHIAILLANHCEDTQLYLQQDLTLSQLSAAIGVNHYYLSQYFASQGTSYYSYIHDLRVRHFVARYRELAAAHQPIVARKLAQESGYHSYSTFSTAFKQRMQKSVAAWMREEVLHEKLSCSSLKKNTRISSSLKPR